MSSSHSSTRRINQVADYLKYGRKLGQIGFGGGYRLLSEVEWEYLARAGTTSVYPWGPDADAGCESMNGADMSARSDYPDWQTATCTDGSHHTAAVGSYRSNAFGLYDMIGNVWEWVQDCYADSYAAQPTGPLPNDTTCSLRVVSGGSWGSVPQNLLMMCAFRRPDLILPERSTDPRFGHSRHRFSEQVCAEQCQDPAKGDWPYLYQCHGPESSGGRSCHESDRRQARARTDRRCIVPSVDVGCRARHGGPT
jgi:hypothetical protein